MCYSFLIIRIFKKRILDIFLLTVTGTCVDLPVEGRSELLLKYQVWKVYISAEISGITKKQ